MKYIGIPTCPYCKKRINIVRVWSVKKHGEFMCPRCKGISNIFLSPLVYVLAVIAISAAFLIYFFQKFISDSISLWTALEVFAPFALFFILSLLMVYLEKPVIKKVRKTPDGRYFDQNGNELKMRMGKLVAANGSGPAVPLPPSEPMRNRNDMTGRIDAPRRQEPSVSYASPPLIPDNDDLYAEAARSLGRDFTEEFSALKEAPKPVSSPVGIPPERVQKSDPERAQKTPPERAKRIAPERPPQRVRPPVERQPVAPRRPLPPDDLPVGRVAGERNGMQTTKSGFEDIIAEYQNPKKTEVKKKPESPSKGGGFRQL